MSQSGRGRFNCVVTNQMDDPILSQILMFLLFRFHEGASYIDYLLMIWVIKSSIDLCDNLGHHGENDPPDDLGL